MHLDVRRFSRMIPSIRKLSYEDRLKELGLWSLEDRQVRADLIEVYKIIHGISSVDPQTFFELSTHNRTIICKLMESIDHS